MNRFARITAIALIVIGILVMLSGIISAAAGGLTTGMHRFGGAVGQMPFHRPMGGGFGLSLLFGAAVFVQGLVVTALGQGLYLLSSLAGKTGEPTPTQQAPAKQARK